MSKPTNKNKCWLCNGKGKMHTGKCAAGDPTVFRGRCTCGEPACPTCHGTKIKPRHLRSKEAHGKEGLSNV